KPVQICIPARRAIGVRSAKRDHEVMPARIRLSTRAVTRGRTHIGLVSPHEIPEDRFALRIEVRLLQIRELRQVCGVLAEAVDDLVSCLRDRSAATAHVAVGSRYTTVPR